MLFQSIKINKSLSGNVKKVQPKIPPATAEQHRKYKILWMSSCATEFWLAPIFQFRFIFKIIFIFFYILWMKINANILLLIILKRENNQFYLSWFPFCHPSPLRFLPPFNFTFFDIEWQRAIWHSFDVVLLVACGIWGDFRLIVL